MQVLIIPSGRIGNPAVPTIEDLANVLHAGGVRVYFDSSVPLGPDDLDSEGVPTASVELGLTTEAGGKVFYSQDQKKRISQGKIAAQRTDVQGESLALEFNLLSLHGNAGDQLRNKLSGGRILNGEVGKDGPGTYTPFSITLVADNYYPNETGYRFFVASLYAAVCKQFEILFDDHQFTEIHVQLEGQLHENESNGIGHFFSQT